MSDILLWQIFIRVSINSICTKIALNIYILLIKAFKTLVQVEISKVLRESGLEDRHLVAKFENNRAQGSRFERVRSLNFNGKWSNWLPVEIFFFHRLFDTPMHLWDQSAQIARHRNPLKNGSLSENVTKEGERGLFQPLNWKRYCKGLCCGHFYTSTDLVARILQFWEFFSQEQFVKSNFK